MTCGPVLCFYICHYFWVFFGFLTWYSCF